VDKTQLAIQTSPLKLVGKEAVATAAVPIQAPVEEQKEPMNGGLRP